MDWGLGHSVKSHQKNTTNDYLFSFTAFCNAIMFFVIITGGRGRIPPEILKIEMLCGGIWAILRINKKGPFVCNMGALLHHM